MDVTFEMQRGISFSIEVGFFDTILEIKEKIQKYQGIPISKQTLIFNGQILQDDGDIWKCAIFQNSRIHLIIAAADSDYPKLPIDQDTKFHIKVKTSSSKSHIPIEINKNDTVLKLKEKIHDIDQNNIPLSKVMSHATRMELHDNQFLCDVSEKSETDVSFKPQVSAVPTMVSGGGGGGGGEGASKKLKLMVLPKSGTKKVAVEMNASDNVGELRKELHRLNQSLQFHLPPEGYFFIYKQNVMDDDKSFRWHHVSQGDTIEIFNGSVTGGS